MGAHELAFHLAGVIDFDVAAITEEGDQYSQSHSRFGGGHGEYEEHEHLTVDVAQVTRESDEIEDG